MTDKEFRARARKILPLPVGDGELVEVIMHRLRSFPDGCRLIRAYDNYVGAVGGYI